MKRTTIITAAAIAVLCSAGGATATSMITSGQIADGTIQASDIDPSVLDAIDDTDPAYPHRTATIEHGYDAGDEIDYHSLTVRIPCPAGTRPVNGGIDRTSTEIATVTMSYPTRTGWAVELWNGSEDTDDTVRAFAVCI